MHVGMYAVRMYACTYVGMYVCMSERMQVGRYVGMYVCTHVRMQVCMYIGMHVGVYVGRYVGLYVYAQPCRGLKAWGSGFYGVPKGTHLASVEGFYLCVIRQIGQGLYMADRLWVVKLKGC